jgi:hypothetical protein
MISLYKYSFTINSILFLLFIVPLLLCFELNDMTAQVIIPSMLGCRSRRSLKIFNNSANNEASFFTVTVCLGGGVENCYKDLVVAVE